MTAALFFVALAGFGSGAFDALALFAFGADLGFFFGALAIFGLALARFNQSQSAGIAFFIGQRTQHNAGTRTRRALLGTAFAAAGRRSATA